MTSLLDAPVSDDARARPTAVHPGLSLPALGVAALVCAPAIWQCLVRHAMAFHVMLERYVVVAVGCLLVCEVARRCFRPAAEAPEPTEPAGPAGPGADAGLPSVEAAAP